jgi:hypothetical protein
MISSHDRSYYIGASDTSYVIGNWDTKTFEKWYNTKLGIYEMNFTNDAMLAGTHYEHRILDALNIFDLETDKQIIIGRLRVNLDGNTDDTIYEVKTYGVDKPFKVSKAYRCQVNVEMYAFNIRKAYIVAYGLEDKDYDNYYRDIDNERLKLYPIEYDEDFINNEYLPKLKYLSECLDKGIFPQQNVKEK